MESPYLTSDNGLTCETLFRCLSVVGGSEQRSDEKGYAVGVLMMLARRRCNKFLERPTDLADAIGTVQRETIVADDPESSLQMPARWWSSFAYLPHSLHSNEFWSTLCNVCMNIPLASLR